MTRNPHNEEASERSMPEKKQIRFTSILERSDNKLWGAHIGVPAAIARKLIDGASRRVVCTLNGSVQFQCALLPRTKGSFLVTVNKQIRAQLDLKPGMTIEVALVRDESKYGLPMPEEFDELLRQDKGVRSHFNNLTPGKKRTLLHFIGSVKNSETRIHRAIVVARHLVTNEGKIDYKKLYREVRKK